LIAYGIADAHGIETVAFAPDLETAKEDKNLGFMLIRVLANRHRHAVVFLAEVTPEAAKQINDLVKKSKFIEALKLLKASAKETWFPDQYAVQFSKSWNLIPNPDLDPWR